MRAVCKWWLSIIDDPCFVRAHTNRQLSSNTTTILIRNSSGPPFFPLYTVDLETLNPTYGCHNISATPLNFNRSGLSRLTDLNKVATCDGLMLVAPKDSAAENWEIWNPLTHERLELPHRKFNRFINATGLGFDHANDDYKAVVVDYCERSYPRSKPIVFETHVYSLKSDSWRKIMGYPRGHEGTYGTQGVFLRGALHWISSTSSRDHDKILVLDLGTESYREMKMPPCRVLNEYDYNEMPSQYQELGMLGGCLVVSDAGEDIYFDLWVRKDYGAEDSWTKVFKSISGRNYYLPGRNFSLPSYYFVHFKPIAYMKKKTQVFMQAKGVFWLLDLQIGFAKMVSIHCLCGLLSAQVFHGTIFRLHDNCGVSGRRRKRKITSKSKKKMANTELKYCVRGCRSDSHYCCT